MFRESKEGCRAVEAKEQAKETGISLQCFGVRKTGSIAYYPSARQRFLKPIDSESFIDRDDFILFQKFSDFPLYPCYKM